MPAASLLWDALVAVAAYALAMWPLWAPVLAAVVASLVLRARVSRRQDRLDKAQPNPRWIGPVFGLVWLVSVAIFMT